MLNGRFTVFGLKNGEPAWAEEMLLDTEKKEVFDRFMKEAPRDGYKITRVYRPDTKLSEPDFMRAINV